MVRWIGVAALAAALSGCVPIRAYDTPTIHATVIDARTQAPLAGARVAVISRLTSERPSGVTNASGTADLPPVTYWTVIPVMLDPINIEATVQVEADGYKARSARVCFWPVKDDPDFRLTIALTPGTGPDNPMPGDQQDCVWPERPSAP